MSFPPIIQFTPANPKIFHSQHEGNRGYQEDSFGFIPSGDVDNSILRDEQTFKSIVETSFKNVAQTLNDQQDGGSTATAVFVGPENIGIANIGDSPAYMCIVNDSGVVRIQNLLKGAHPVTRKEYNHEHKAINPDEQQRVKSAGGEIIQRGKYLRLSGRLLVTRSFGDMACAPGMSSTPDTLFMPFPELKDGERLLIVVGSDGLNQGLNEIDSSQIAGIIAAGINAQKNDLAGYLTEMAFARNPGKSDNITTLVLEYAKPPVNITAAIVCDGHGPEGGDGANISEKAVTGLHHEFEAQSAILARNHAPNMTEQAAQNSEKEHTPRRSETIRDFLKQEYIEVTQVLNKIPADNKQLGSLAIRMMTVSHAEGERGKKAKFLWRAIYALTKREDYPQNINRKSFTQDIQLLGPFDALLKAWEATTGKEFALSDIRIPTDEELKKDNINIDTLQGQSLGLDDQILNAFDVTPKLQELQRLQPALELLTPHGEVIPPEIQKIVDALMKPAPSTNDGIKEAPPSISAPDKPISEQAQTPPVAPTTPNTETAPVNEENLYQSIPGFSALGTELQQGIVAEFQPPAIRLQKPTISGKSRPAIDFVTLAPRQESGKKPLLVFCPTLKTILVHPELQQVAKNLLTTYACSGWKIEKRASINANNSQLYRDQLSLLLGTKAPDETYRKAVRQEVADYTANASDFGSRDWAQLQALAERRQWFVENATPHDFKALKAISGNPDTAKIAATPPADYDAVMDSASGQERDRLQAAFSNNKNATSSVPAPETPVATPNSTARRASVLKRQAQNNGAFKPWAAQKKENVKAAFAAAKRFCTEPQFAWNVTRNAAIATIKNSPKILVGAVAGYGVRTLAAGAVASSAAIAPAFLATASVLCATALVGATASVSAKLVKDLVFDRQAFKQETYKQSLLKTAAWGAFGGLIGGIINQCFATPHETVTATAPTPIQRVVTTSPDVAKTPIVLEAATPVQETSRVETPAPINATPPPQATEQAADATITPETQPETVTTKSVEVPPATDVRSLVPNDVYNKLDKHFQNLLNHTDKPHDLMRGLQEAAAHETNLAKKARMILKAANIANEHGLQDKWAKLANANAAYVMGHGLGVEKNIDRANWYADPVRADAAANNFPRRWNNYHKKLTRN
ncbi:MAG: hypothetical protein ABTQ34_07765 [Bdellovibrionales bacterium]